MNLLSQLSWIAVTNRHLSARPFPEQIERICERRPRALILREKDLPETEYETLAREVQQICADRKIPFLPHFYPETAKKLHLDCVHLPLWKLREGISDGSLTSFSTLGTSVHSVEEAKEAVRLGAAYITCGHIFATDCKKGLPPRGLPFLKEVCETAEIPVLAIGGISFDEGQIRSVLNCGAAGACIMSACMKI